MKRICILLILSLSLCSCASTQNGGSNPAMGSGIGAIGGAILGQVLGKSTEATIIGGALGAVIGYAVALQIDSQTNKVYDAQQTKAMVPVDKREEPVLQIQAKSIAPSEQIQVGENVTVKVTYILFDENMDRIPVREKKSIWHNGKLVKVIGDTEEVRENGTYESLVSFKLPGEIEKGDYEVRHDINTNSLSTNSTTHFTII